MHPTSRRPAPPTLRKLCEATIVSYDTSWRPYTAWTVDVLDAAYACGGGERPLGLDAPRHAGPGVRIAFVADPNGNVVELLSSDEYAPPI